MDTKIALGTAQIGFPYGVANKTGVPDVDDLREILAVAKRHHINLLDTASAYGNSESRLGNLIASSDRSYWKICTKYGMPEEDAIAVVRDRFQFTCEQLGFSPAIVLAHSAEDFVQYKSFRGWLALLKYDGLVEKIGVSVYNAEQIRHVLECESVDVIQLPMNILDQRLVNDGTIAGLCNAGIEVHARSIFLQGLFFMHDEEIRLHAPSAVEPIRKLREIAEADGMSLPQLSLLWVHAVPEVSKVIIGVDRASQLQENLDLLSRELDNTILESVRKVVFEDENALNPALWLKK